MQGTTLSVPIMSPTISTAITPDPYYCQNLKLIGRAYKSIHGYSSVTVCTFGLLANTLNLIVLTRKEMINSTNLILTGLALADLFNMLEYVPFAVYMNFLPDEDGTERKTYPWAVYVLVHSNFSQVCHTISIWLTLTLAVWRYIMIAMPVRCKTLCSMERAKWLIAIAYMISPLLCLPIYFTFSISAISPASSPPLSKVNSSGITEMSDLIEDFNGTMVTVEQPLVYSTTFMTPNIYSFPFENATQAGAASSDVLLENHYQQDTSVKYVVNLSALAKKYPLLMTANFWFYSVVLKLLPCVMLTVVSLRLINSLLEAKRRKEKLLGIHIASLPAVNVSHADRSNSTVAPIPPIPNPTAFLAPPPTSSGMLEETSSIGGSRSGSFTRPTGEMCVTTRTTRMLLAVLLLFLITEFPQGILALLSDLLGDKFFKECYYPLSDLMDFVALLNSAINFILYCSMSTRFRDVFCQVFHLTPILNFCERRRSRPRQSSIASNTAGDQMMLATISGNVSAAEDAGGSVVPQLQLPV